MRGKGVWAEVVTSLLSWSKDEVLLFERKKGRGFEGPLLCGGGKLAWVLGVRTMSTPGATSMIPSALAMVGSVDPTPFLNLTDTPLLVWSWRARSPAS